MAQSKKIVIANWKMNPQTFAEARKLFGDIVRKTKTIKGVEIIVCPPFVYISELEYSYRGKKILFGAQDVFWELKGSYTGYVSPTQIQSVGVKHVIIGHSERRVLGETNEMVNKKVITALKIGMRVVVCVGEHERDDHGTHLSFIREELETAFCGVSTKMLSRVTVAYEPIWAIGKSASEAMQPSQVHETVLFIKKVLAEKYGKKVGLNVSILYGGSAEPSNVENIMKRGTVNGFLVGGASLNADPFSDIIRIVSKC